MDRIKKLLPWLICIVIDLLVVIGVWSWSYHCGRTSMKAEEVIDTSYVITSNYKSPTLINEVGIGDVSVPVAIFPKSIKFTDTSKHIPDSAILGTYSHDMGTKDSFRVHIPITQKEYRDSNYTAWVSGYMSQLDSIEVYSKIITHTKIETKYRRWNIGITGGYGYGFVSHKVEPFMGVGVTYSIFR